MSSTQPKSIHIEPVDDETPNKTSGTMGHDVEANAFSKAIDKIVKANYSSSKPKLWEPNPFNGSNSWNSALLSSNVNSIDPSPWVDCYAMPWCEVIKCQSSVCIIGK